ncbi:DUF1631 family protein [sulfur-oxidizing endosymbiont of Gigantopelta aegis]|uniref:DUF1631 family protein n=1 Tax=sulfur-oxidizing endosymbiont of Gigantopelta aegis TaxID=2794934 RepID=UPI0018DC9EED|nr:DUF1631 family protein [sulfur-oxidizing endosymbiont of Gigantopelta aegis]
MKNNINASLAPLFNITERWFSVFLRQFSDRLTDELIDKAEQTTSVTVQSDCFTALHSLKNSVDEAIPLFIDSLSESFYTSKAGQTFDGSFSNNLSTNKRSRESLNLIATKDLEENLSFDTVIEKINQQNREAFEHLETRIFALLKLRGEEISKSPLSADTILSAFRSSMHTFDFSPDVRLQVYKLFEQFLAVHLPALLDELNNALIKQGILPEIISDYRIKKEYTKPLTPPLSKSEEIPSPIETQDNYNQNNIPGNEYPEFSPTANSTLTHFSPPSTRQQRTSTLNNRHLELAQNLARNKTSLNQNTGTRKQLNQLLTKKRSTPVIFSSLQENANNHLLQLHDVYAENHLNKNTQNNDNFTHHHETSTQELISSLQALHHNALLYDAMQSSPSIHLQIKNNILADTNKQSHSTALKNKKLHLIDMIEDLFTHIENNKHLSIRAKKLFRRLMIPIIHLSLVDDTFINNTTHVARHFLDDFANAAFGITDTEESINNPVYLKLKKISTQLGRENKINKAIFSELDGDLKQFVNYRKQQANHTRKQPQAVKANLQSKVDNIVQQAIKDKEIPPGIHLFIDKIWKNVLLNIYSDNSSSDDMKERANAFISALIFSITATQKHIERVRIQRLIPIINEELQFGLARVHCPKNIQDKITLAIKKLHHAALQSTEGKTKQQPNNLNNEPDKIIFRNELFDDSQAADGSHLADGSQVAETAKVNSPESAPESTLESVLDSKAMHSELTQFDEEINTPTKVVVTEVSTLEEAFVDSIAEEDALAEQAPKKTGLTHLINRPTTHCVKKNYTPEKQSKTDFELIRLVNNSYKLQLIDDEYTYQVKNITEDSWLEFCFKSHYSRARVTWVKDDKSQFSCLTQNNRVIEISLEALSDSFRQGIGSIVQASSLMGDAIQAVSDSAMQDKGLSK